MPMSDSEGSRKPPPDAALAEGASALLFAFLEWRRRCALAACSAPSAARLREFAVTRFDAFCRRYAPFPAARVPHPLTPAAGDCWHLFETHLTVDETRAGKRYKQWLFEAARAGDGPPLARLTGGAALLMRDVVRTWLAREGPRPRTDSLQAPLGADVAGARLTLEDLLPGESDPADEAAQRDLERCAAVIAERGWPDLDRRERIVLAARECGRTLSDPAVERAAECRKSMLYAAFRAVLARLAAQLRRDCRGEAPSALAALARLALAELSRRAFHWAKSEKSCTALFSKAAAQAAPTGKRGGCAM